VKGMKTVSRRVSRKRSALVKLSDLVGSNAAGKAKTGNSVWRVKYGGAVAASEIRGKPLGARRTGEHFAEAVHLQKIA